MSLRERAVAALRAECERTAAAPPSKNQVKAADHLGRLCGCDVDPATLIDHGYQEWPYEYVEGVVDGERFRVAILCKDSAPVAGIEVRVGGKWELANTLEQLGEVFDRSKLPRGWFHERRRGR